MEIVPIEAVVAIIEIKRTLSSQYAPQAVEQLRRICRAVSIRKNDPTSYLPGGVPVGSGLVSPYHSNPMLGIVGAISETWLSNRPAERVRDMIAAPAESNEPGLDLDILLSMDGTLVATIDDTLSDRKFKAINPRHDRPCEVAGMSSLTDDQRRQAVAFGFGFMLSYIQECCGRVANLEGYFFNQSLIGDL
jgi:hypothetical protein